MIVLTPEQREAMSHRQESPPRALDPDAQVTYVLLREEVFDRVRSLLSNDAEESLNEIYPHVMEVFGRAGWDDPSMDIYNELDPRRQS